MLAYMDQAKFWLVLFWSWYHPPYTQASWSGLWMLKWQKINSKLVGQNCIYPLIRFYVFIHMNFWPFQKNFFCPLWDSFLVSYLFDHHIFFYLYGREDDIKHLSNISAKLNFAQWITNQLKDINLSWLSCSSACFDLTYLQSMLLLFKKYQKVHQQLDSDPEKYVKYLNTVDKNCSLIFFIFWFMFVFLLRHEK